MKKKILPLVAMAFFALVSCQSSKNNVASAPINLEGEWNIVEVNGSAITIKEMPYIGFDAEEGRVYGNAGCNNIMGAYKQNVETGSLDLGQLASTMMAGPNMDVERNVLNALGQVKGYKSVSKDEIALCNEKNRPVVVLKKRSQEMPLKDLNGEWSIVKVYGEDVSAELEKRPFLAFDIDKKNINGCASCNNIRGSFIINDVQKQSITFQNIASTRMMCPDMTLENNIIQILNKADHYGRLANGNLVLYIGGKQVMELAKNRG